MKKVALIVVAAMLVATLIPAASAGGNNDRTEELHAELESMGYTIAFEDNFDGDEIDYTKWRVGYDVGAGEDGALRRAGYYEVSDDTIDVSDGVLTVSTLYKDGQYGEGWYTCWLETSVLGSMGSEAPILCSEEDYRGFESTYGYFEVRCIAPPCEGIWSAFWMMPNSEGMSGLGGEPGGADGVEVDVMIGTRSNATTSSMCSTATVTPTTRRKAPRIYACAICTPLSTPTGCCGRRRNMCSISTATRRGARPTTSTASIWACRTFRNI